MQHNHGQSGAPGHPEQGPPIGVHGMLVVGDETVYLSHLPMFMFPHNFQVILEVTLDPNANRLLRDFHAHFGSSNLFTLKPDEFSIVDLLSANSSQPALTAFKGGLFHGHFEKGGDIIAQDALVHVESVIHFGELGPAITKASELEYLLFGKGQEFFLAHWITQPPDFDQVLAVSVTGHEFTADEIDREHSGVHVTILGRPNTSPERLRRGETVPARGQVTGEHQVLDLQVEVLSEIYFEEGELRQKPTFAPTREEKASGFDV